MTDSKTSVATMDADDFRANEQSVVLQSEDTLSIVHVATDGTETVLKPSLPVLAGEVVDSTVMRAAALDAFLREQIASAKEQGVLFSLHLKATMMKVSDPILFGHAVRAFLPYPVLPSSASSSTQAGLSANNGLGGILAGVEDLDADHARRRHRRHREGPGRRPGSRRWSTPTRASPTSTSPPTSSSTPRCPR